MRLFSLFLILVTCLLSAGPARAADPLNACYIEWPPYTRIIDKRAEGITVDLLREASKRADFDITFTNLPWKRCLIMVQRAQMDFAMEAIDRPGFIHGKHPSALYIQAFWTRENADYGPFKYIGSLTQYRLGLMQGYQYSDKILNAGFKVIEWVRTEEIAGVMVSMDRLDLVFADAVVMQNVIREKNLKLKPMLPVYNVQALYPSFNVSMGKKRDRIDLALGEMHADGTVDRVYRHHTGVDFSDFVKLGSEVRAPASTD